MSDEHDPADAVGSITHWYSHLSVAAVRLTKPLKVGDKIHIKGRTTDVTQTVDSLEVDRKKIDQAKPGDDVALHVDGHVRDNDMIFRED
jgi:putative protease